MNALALRGPLTLRPFFLALGLLLVAIWAFGQAYINRDSRTCLALYRAATTAADTLRVDGTLPLSGSTTREAHSCGFIRQTARWF
jgi:hypothetical protein